MPLTPDKIRKEATSLEVYERGLKYARYGRVLAWSADAGGDRRCVKGRVQGSEIYDPVAWLDSSGEIVDHDCDCPAHEKYDGMCKHLVALLYKMYRDQGGEPVEAHHAPEAPKALRTDAFASLLMSRRATQERATAEALALPDDQRIALVPRLTLTPSAEGLQPSLELSVGQARKYVVRDISKFAEDLRMRNRTAYGKGLEFTHAPERFEEEARPLLQFVLDQSAQVRHYIDVFGLYRHAAEVRAIPLAPDAFDRLFHLLLGRTVDVEKKGHILVDGDPEPTLTVREVPGGISLTSAPYGLIVGADRSYLVTEDAIHRLSAEMTAKSADFLLMLMRAQFKMDLAAKDLPAFCGDVLAGVRDNARLDGDVEAIEQYRALPLDVGLYLDYEKPDAAYLDVVFAYGDKRFRPYTEDRTARAPVARDRHEEAKALATVARYFPQLQPDGRRAMLRGEDQLFRLVDEGLDALRELGTLYVTDRARKLGSAPQPRVAVRAALEGGLLSLDMDVGEFPIEELYGALNAYRERRGYHRLRDGRFLRLEGGALGELAAMADGLDLTEKQLSQGSAELPAYRALYLDRALRDGEDVKFDRDATFRAAVRGLRSAEDGDFPQPPALNGTLRKYQATGYQWLRALQSLHFNGILADDMGLGKTVQVIALLLSAYEEEGATTPSLIVCPASLVLNWMAEIARFAPTLKAHAILGDNATRARAIAELDDCQVAVTSYDLIKRDVERYQGRTYLYLVIDEAQYIKNRFTQNARAVKAVASEYRLALTGTPVENHLGELWSIFDFLMPGYLYSDRKFREKYETPIVKSGDEGARRQLSRMAAPFILRRLKRDVLKELPPKNESVLYATMEAEQRKLYLANLAQARSKVEGELMQTGIERNRIQVLALLTRLRQLCCDPRLCYEDYAGGSAKLELCMELLREAKEGGHRTLLFSQFTSMLELIRTRMDEEGFRYSVLTGDTSKEERARLVEAFNQGNSDAFLISLKAGGTGLNLTGADVVIHYDPWWNVAAQNQATDRAHRIGQTRGVQVYKLIARDSVEEKIMALQEMKRDLADAVISESAGAEVLSMTAEQLAALLAEA